MSKSSDGSVPTLAEPSDPLADEPSGMSEDLLAHMRALVRADTLKRRVVELERELLEERRRTHALAILAQDAPCPPSDRTRGIDSRETELHRRYFIVLEQIAGSRIPGLRGRIRNLVTRHTLGAYLRREDVFRDAEYLELHPDVRDAELDPLEHYLRSGGREGRAPRRFGSDAE